MRLLYPLGFLGLLGLLILLIIYILKPNFEQKFVSSTHIWKMSLRYKRRKIPLNKLKNLLIIICQIMIISLSAFALTKPFIAEAVEPPKTERIVILDASASMLAKEYKTDEAINRSYTGLTRFEKAVMQIKADGTQSIEAGERITVIFAAAEAKPILIRGTDIDGFTLIMDSLIYKYEVNEWGETVAVKNLACTFAEADIDGAMTLAEGYLNQNPLATIKMYTATTYDNADDRIEIIDVSKRDRDKYGDETEWNAALLNITATMDEGYYRFAVDVASYNADANVTLYFMAFGINGAPSYEEMDENPTEYQAVCLNGQTHIARFNDLNIFSFSSVHVWIEEDDSLDIDNHFFLYGGVKETLRIMYISPAPSDFYNGILSSLPVVFAERWDIQFESTSLQNLADEERKPEGCDLYIFEYQMPDAMPTDGVVFLIVDNPVGSSGPDGKGAPKGSGLVFQDIVDKRTADPETCRLHFAEPSQLMSRINPNNIYISRYRIVTYDDGYVPLMYIKEVIDNPLTWQPVFLVKNTPAVKVAAMTFSSYYSDFSVSFEYVTMMYNMLEYFFPSTVSRYIYDIGQSPTFDVSEAILEETKPVLKVSYPDEIEYDVFDAFPYNISTLRPGTYAIQQQLISGRTVTENFFVKIPASESNFNRTAKFETPVVPPPDKLDLDIYVYLGATLLALVFVERILAKREI